jgi:hypothetical protein
MPSHYISLRSILISSSHSSLSLTRDPFLHAWISLLSHMCQMPRPSEPRCCYHPNDMVSNIHHVAPHYAKIFRTRSNSFSDALIPHRKCFLSRHFSAELWHAHSEQQHHTSDLSALYIYVLKLTDFTLFTADIITLFTKQFCLKFMNFILFPMKKMHNPLVVLCDVRQILNE